jgi:hypothetical protein
MHSCTASANHSNIRELIPTSYESFNKGISFTTMLVNTQKQGAECLVSYLVISKLNIIRSQSIAVLLSFWSPEIISQRVCQHLQWTVNSCHDMQGKNTAIWHHLSYSYKICHLSYKILWRMVWPGIAGQPTSSSDGLRASPWYVTQNLSLATSPCHNSPTNPSRCLGPCHHYPALLTDYCIHSHRPSLYGSPLHRMLKLCKQKRSAWSSIQIPLKTTSVNWKIYSNAS